MMIRLSQPIIKKEEIDAVVKVLKSGMIAQGSVVKKFEEVFAGYCGTREAVAVSSGTAALHVALHVLGIKEGDEVITTPFTFIATANAILMTGAKPVFADILEGTFNIDPVDIEKKITKKTKAIIVVDLYGQVYDVKAINKIAKKYRLKIIEDACQAHGAGFQSKRAGTFGDIGCFSLYATKNITTGEGGMIVMNNKTYATRARQFRQHGRSEKKSHTFVELGFNYRMTDIAAALGIEQLKRINYFNQTRIQHAKMLTKGLNNIKGLITPLVQPGYNHIFHQYTIRTSREFKISRDALLHHLKNNGIEGAIFYQTPLHLQPHFLKLGYKKGDFPIAEKLSKEVLSLPVHPLVSQKDVDLIIKTIKAV